MPIDSFPELYRHNCSFGPIIKEGFNKVMQLSSGTVDFYLFYDGPVDM